jgi:hypothetical protein
MGSFTKKSNARNKRARITRRKRRSSRTKYTRPRYKKRGGREGSTETMSKSIVKSFPIMEHFPSCGTCMAAIDNSVSKNKSEMERNMKLNTNLDSQTQDSWNGWTSDELEELGVPNNTTSKLIPSMGSPNFKAPIKKTDNPYGRKHS